MGVSRVYVALFIVFLSTTFFGVLNIITSVFVESAMQSEQHSRELMLEEKGRVEDVYASHLKTIFAEMDADGSGLIEWEELRNAFSTNDDVRKYMEVLDINVTDVRKLFELLDVNGSGEIDVDEFCAACPRLKGDASSFDVQMIMLEHR